MTKRVPGKALAEPCTEGGLAESSVGESILGARRLPTTIPLPVASPVSRPFWDACRAHRLVVQRCGACGNQFFPPQPACTRCLSSDIVFHECTGRGIVYSYTTVWRPQNPGFEIPYIVAIIQLEEGWHLATNLLDCSPERVEIGLPVEVRFTEMSDTVTLPYFVPSLAPGLNSSGSDSRPRENETL